MKNKGTEQVAKNIRILLADKGLNQQEFASKVGISNITLYRLLKGTTDWQMQWAIRATTILGVTLDDIFLDRIVPNGEKRTETAQ